MGGRRWYMMGCYLDPHYASTFERVVMEIDHRHRGIELLLAGKLNSELSSPDRHDCDEAISTDMVIEGLENMAAHLITCHSPWKSNGWTWIIICCGQEVRSWAYYTLGKDHCMLRTVSVWYPRNYTDHYLVLGCLCGAIQRDHQHYLCMCTHLPLHTPRHLS